MPTQLHCTRLHRGWQDFDCFEQLLETKSEKQLYTTVDTETTARCTLYRAVQHPTFETHVYLSYSTSQAPSKEGIICHDFTED